MCVRPCACAHVRVRAASPLEDTAKPTGQESWGSGEAFEPGGNRQMAQVVPT